MSGDVGNAGGGSGDVGREPSTSVVLSNRTRAFNAPPFPSPPTPSKALTCYSLHETFSTPSA